MRIDPRLSAPCDKPILAGNTNRDVWALSVEQKYALIECDARMEIIRKLSED